MSEKELREALRGQIVRHDTPDGDCWCWPLNTPWHEGWLHSPACQNAAKALASLPAEPDAERVAEIAAGIAEIGTGGTPAFIRGYNAGSDAWQQTAVEAMTLTAELREAYTLLVSLEPLIVRDARSASGPTTAHFKALRLNRVREWVDRYRDDFEGGVARRLAAAIETTS